LERGRLERGMAAALAAAMVSGSDRVAVRERGSPLEGAALPRKGSGTLKRLHSRGEGRHSSTVRRGPLASWTCTTENENDNLIFREKIIFVVFKRTTCRFSFLKNPLRTIELCGY